MFKRQYLSSVFWFLHLKMRLNYYLSYLCLKYLSLITVFEIASIHALKKSFSNLFLTCLLSSYLWHIALRILSDTLRYHEFESIDNVLIFRLSVLFECVCQIWACLCYTAMITCTATSSISQIPITLQKESGGVDHEGREVLKCGFKIGGGIDQDFRKSPQGYTDNVSSLH